MLRKNPIEHFKNKINKYLNNNILIYQMGKVGSSSIDALIPDSFQINDFYYTPPCFVHRKLAYNTFFKHLVHKFSLFFKRNLYKVTHKKIKIITIVRDPFKRNISMFFQALPYWIIEYEVGIASSGKGVGARVESNTFLNDCYNETFTHSYPIEWFDKELLRYTGVNIYDHEYDSNKGYMKIHQGKYEILLIEMMKINDLTDVIEDFSEQKLNKITSKNSGTQKWYASLYKTFKEKHTLNDEHHASIINSNYYKKFYKLK